MRLCSTLLGGPPRGRGSSPVGTAWRWSFSRALGYPGGRGTPRTATAPWPGPRKKNIYTTSNILTLIMFPCSLLFCCCSYSCRVFRYMVGMPIFLTNLLTRFLTRVLARVWGDRKFSVYHLDGEMQCTVLLGRTDIVLLFYWDWEKSILKPNVLKTHTLNINQY